MKTLANMGAYLSTFASSVPTYLYGTLMAGQYKTPAIYVEVQSLFTNTAPVDAYRGAGRPEATYVVERIVETAAREMGIDPAQLRRKNFIAPGDFPYETPVALTYDTGNYEASLARALEHADYAGFGARKAASEAAGKKRGIGFSCYIEACGLAPSQVAISLGAGVGLFEVAEVRVDVTGSVTVVTGSHSHGQSHETTFAQVISEKLGVPFENVTVLHGDTGPLRLCPRHLRFALAGGGRLGDCHGHRQDHCQGQEDRRPHAGGERRSGGLRGRHFHGGGLEPVPHLPGSGVRGVRSRQLSVGGTGARPVREGVLRPAQLHLSRRGAHLRGGGRSGHRRRGHHELRRRGTTSATSSIR